MTKLVRNTATADGRAFWASVERAAARVKDLPQWKKVGVIVDENQSSDLPAGSPNPKAPSR